MTKAGTLALMRWILVADRQTLNWVTGVAISPYAVSLHTALHASAVHSADNVFSGLKVPPVQVVWNSPVVLSPNTAVRPAPSVKREPSPYLTTFGHQ